MNISLTTRAASCLLLTLTGCVSHRYITVRLTANVPKAYVNIVDSGESVGAAPDHPTLHLRFRGLPPRRYFLHLRYRSPGLCDDIVPIQIAGRWKRSKEAAASDPDPFSVEGVLVPCPCLDK